MTTCITIAELLELNPCPEGVDALRQGLPYAVTDETPIPAWEAASVVPLDDALWALDRHPALALQRRLFAVWCARSALIYTNDWRVVQAVNVAERYAHGQATQAQLDAASDAVMAAANDASDVG